VHINGGPLKVTPVTGSAPPTYFSPDIFTRSKPTLTDNAHGFKPRRLTRVRHGGIKGTADGRHKEHSPC